MLILPTNPSGFSIFCDDVRYEHSGKQILVGVYDGTIIIGGPAPTIIPQLCVLTTMRFDEKMLPKKIVLKIIYEDENFAENDVAMMETELPATVSPDGVDLFFSDRDGARLPQLKSESRISNLILASNGRIKVRLYVDDDIYALGSLRVIFQANIDATEPEPVLSN